MRSKTVLLLVASLALPAAAGAQSTTPQVPWPRRPPASQPPAQPAPGQPAPAQPQAQTAPQVQDPSWDAQAKQRLDALHALNDTEIQVGKVAQQRAQAQQVKDLANRIVSEHQAIEAQLQALAKKRGITVGATSNQAQIEQGRAQTIGALQATAAGADFDKLYVRHEIDAHQEIEDQLKALRDETPGRDAELKKWLDDTENTAEAHLAAARQAKSALDAAPPVQARTPGK
jgi:putative membrane protein